MDIIGKVLQMTYDEGKSAASGKEWQKQTVIIETQDTFPKKVCIDIFGKERIEEFGLKLEEVVTLSIDVSSREYNGRWYTSVTAWGCKHSNGIQTPQPGIPQEAPKGQPSVFPQPTPGAAVDNQPQANTGLPF